MFIKDLEARQTNVDIEAEVLEVSDVREFNKFGKQGRVANAIIKDGTGKVKLSLWNEQIDQVKPGNTVKIQKGYVGEFQGELQLTTGKFGTLEVEQKEEGAGETTPEEKPAEPEPSTPEPKAEPAAAPATEPAKKAADESLDVEEEDFS